MGDAFDLRHHIDAEGRTRELDRHLAAVATRQHGVVARRQLVALGLGRGAIARRLGTGRLHPVHRGVYAVGHRALRREAMWMAAVLVADRAVLSHRSAAALWGIRAGERSATEVTVPRALKPRTRLQIHQAHLLDDEVTTHRGIPVTTPARTLLDLATVLPRQQLERAATEAEIRRLGSPTSLAALLARYPTRAGTKTIRELLEEHAIGRHVTKHELELRFLAFLDDHALPRPQTNTIIETPGHRLEVDCLWAHQRLIAELDGYSTHATRTAFEHDRARDRSLTTAGYRVIRITWRQLTNDPSTLAGQIRTMLQSGPP